MLEVLLELVTVKITIKVAKKLPNRVLAEICFFIVFLHPPGSIQYNILKSNCFKYLCFKVGHSWFTVLGEQ